MALRLNTPHTRAAAGQVWTAALLFGAALLLTLLTRFVALDLRPMHTDEAVQAGIYLKPMLEGEGYTYLSADGHGPVLVFTTRLLCALTGTDSYAELTEFLLRAVPALYSLALVLVLALLRDGLGKGATGWAMLFTALSPMMVYFSRYYIMEVPLVFFTTLAMAGGWRYSVSRNPAWLALAGVAVGLMHATKETFLIQMIAASLAVLATGILEYFMAGTGIGQINRKFARSKATRGSTYLILAALLAGGVSFLLYSDFFSKPGQFFDSLKSYVEYAKRAEGAGHEKPWWWYLRLLFGRKEEDGWHVGEWPLLALALIGMGKAFLAPPARYENKRFQRFLSFYALALLTGYSLIRYKTPWTILGAEHALVLLAGVGAATLLAGPLGKFYRGVVWAALLATAGYLGAQVWRQNFLWPADAAKNPYVYSHTSPDALRLVKRVEEAAHKQPDPREFTVFIIHPESGHPLPWYFRRFGGGATDAMPEDSMLLSASDVIVTVPEAAPLIGALVSSSHREIQETYLLRVESPLRLLMRRSLLGDLPARPQPAAPPAETPPPAPAEDPAPDAQDAPAGVNASAPGVPQADFTGTPAPAAEPQMAPVTPSDKR